MSQLLSKYHVNANLISKWKDQALQQMSSIFLSPHEASSVMNEQQLKELHAKIRKLTIERDFLELASTKLGLESVKKW
ncbi:MAG: hypothetical protein H0U27_03180 [Nitrosopumilus sp.]|nr:hypothetical protein [Nitrosopumilus sp.]